MYSIVGSLGGIFSGANVNIFLYNTLKFIERRKNIKKLLLLLYDIRRSQNLLFLYVFFLLFNLQPFFIRLTRDCAPEKIFSFNLFMNGNVMRRSTVQTHTQSYNINLYLICENIYCQRVNSFRNVVMRINAPHIM